MDISKALQGDIKGQCPKCSTAYKVSASVAFSKTNNRIVCTGCGETIRFDNSNAIKQVEDSIKDLQKAFRKFK